MKGSLMSNQVANVGHTEVHAMQDLEASRSADESGNARFTQAEQRDAPMTQPRRRNNSHGSKIATCLGVTAGIIGMCGTVACPALALLASGLCKSGDQVGCGLSATGSAAFGVATLGLVAYGCTRWRPQFMH
jgi:hypothetical protein